MRRRDLAQNGSREAQLRERLEPELGGNLKKEDAGQKDRGITKDGTNAEWKYEQLWMMCRALLGRSDYTRLGLNNRT